MISVVIPALNAAAMIGEAVTRLRSDLIREIIVVDGGSEDGTAGVARDAGARVIESPPGRGPQLAAGADAAEGEWLLFLHADTRLGPGWEPEVAAFLGHPNNRLRGAVFTFVLDDDAPAARRLERIVAWRTANLRLPYGDQGLLIHRALYRSVGGYAPLPLMEDVDFVRRLHGRFAIFTTPAITSAERYRRDGYLLRSARNLLCLSLFLLGVEPGFLVKLYK